MRRLLYFMLTAMAFMACSSIDCPVENTVAVRYGVYSTDGIDEVADTLHDTLWVWTQRADGNDTLLLNRGVNMTAFSLPVSYQRPADTLIFLIVDTNQVWTLDTVVVGKEDTPHFESVDCNAHFFHRLTSVASTHRAIDTVFINQPSVNYDQTATHLHIHFKKRP